MSYLEQNRNNGGLCILNTLENVIPISFIVMVYCCNINFRQRLKLLTLFIAEQLKLVNRPDSDQPKKS